jgi:hypothetical protein
MRITAGINQWTEEGHHGRKPQDIFEKCNSYTCFSRELSTEIRGGSVHVAAKVAVQPLEMVCFRIETA